MDQSIVRMAKISQSSPPERSKMINNTYREFYESVIWWKLSYQLEAPVKHHCWKKFCRIGKNFARNTSIGPKRNGVTFCGLMRVKCLFFGSTGHWLYVRQPPGVTSELRNQMQTRMDAEFVVLFRIESVARFSEMQKYKIVAKRSKNRNINQNQRVR